MEHLTSGDFYYFWKEHGMADKELVSAWMAVIGAETDKIRNQAVAVLVLMDAYKRRNEGDWKLEVFKRIRRMKFHRIHLEQALLGCGRCPYRRYQLERMSKPKLIEALVDVFAEIDADEE